MSFTVDGTDSDLNSPQKFTCERHASKLLCALNSIRKKSHFCDGCVFIDGKEIPVQKGILAAASHYFRLVYDKAYDYSSSVEGKPASSMAGHDSEVVDLSPLQITVDTFEIILDYLYTSEIVLDEENIQNILQAADLLLLTDLKQACCEYLLKCITSQNCLGIWDFASRFNCSWVRLKTTQFLENNFRNITNYGEFLQLPLDLLTSLLCTDTLKVQTEGDILDSIIRWVKHDEENRRGHLSDLINNCLRVQLLSESTLQGLVEMYPDIHNFGIQEMIQNKLQCQNGATDKPRGVTNVLVCAGGDSRVIHNFDKESGVRRDAYCFSATPTGNRWLELPPMMQSRSAHSVVEAGGCLYAVGGKDTEDRILGTGEKFDPKVNQWTPISPMNHARFGFGLVAIEDDIYAIGGSNDIREPSTSMEAYNIFSHKWTPLPEMNLRRVWSAYAVVDKKIYVIAGGMVGKLYESVECFDTCTNTWSSVCPMRERRCDARAVACRGNIFVFGGVRRYECPSAMHGGNNIKFCGTEIYNTAQDSWQQVPRQQEFLCTMNDSSQIFSVVKNGDEIWVIGDLEMGGRFECIRAFNVCSRLWRTVSVNGPPNLRGYPCCMLRIPKHVFKQLPNSKPPVQ
ncbi:gigaxonin-like [Saccostrea cucullata]|uniref:gigaxonin-like n=1 Tax=Saccostrea cuccullata TaxID=36930 RepID=UPI002ED23905